MYFKKFKRLLYILLTLQFLLLLFLAYAFEAKLFCYAGCSFFIVSFTAIWLPYLLVNLVIRKKSVQKFKVESGDVLAELKEYLTKNKYIEEDNSLNRNIKAYNKIENSALDRNVVKRVIMVDLNVSVKDRLKLNEDLKVLMDYMKKEMEQTTTKSYYNYIIYVKKNFSKDIDEVLSKGLFIESISRGKYSIDDKVRNCIIPFCYIQSEDSILFGKATRNLYIYEKIKDKIMRVFCE